MYMWSLHEKECLCHLLSSSCYSDRWVDVSTSLLLLSAATLQSSAEPPLASVCSLDQEKVCPWAPSIKNAEDSSSESRSAESSEITRNNRTALILTSLVNVKRMELV